MNPTSFLRARWLLPIDQPPIENGWISTAAGRITAIGRGTPPGPSEDLGDVAVLPRFANAHTHLELSWMAGLVPPASSMDGWITRLMEVRRAGVPGGPEFAEARLRDAITALRESHTILVGDISNTGSTSRAIANGGLSGVVFRELLGFSHPNPESAVSEAWAQAEAIAGVLPSVVAHAPYSVSPALFRAIAAAKRETPLAVHLAESEEELEFLRTGRGPIRETLERLGVWTDAWTVPRCGPVEYLDRIGYLKPGTLVVHGVLLSDDELRCVRDAGSVLVTCPRSNTWVGSGPPPVSRFYASGVRVAIGTDSLASVGSLDMFDELAEVHRLAPDVAPSKLLESATRVGAEALGFGNDFGTLTPGKRAALAVVDIPVGVGDVEAWLVSGHKRAGLLHRERQ